MFYSHFTIRVFVFGDDFYCAHIAEKMFLGIVHIILVKPFQSRPPTSVVLQATHSTLECIKLHLTIGLLLLLMRSLLWTPNAVLVLRFCSLLSTYTIALKSHLKSSAS